MMEPASARYWIGFDLGGTKMLAVLYDDALREVARARRRTKGHEGVDKGLERMVGLVHALIAKAGVPTEGLAGIGVGCPGPLDLDRGIVLEMPNVGWRKVKIGKALSSAFACPVSLLNDVDAGVYGECRFGAARGARCVVGVFAGTGIGGAAVYEDAIIRGARGSCMEIGHMPIALNGPLCGCGRRGCLEAVAGRLAISMSAAAAAYRGEAPHLLASAGTDLREIRSRAIADAIASGDVVIEQIVREAARTIGWALAGVINLLAPDVVLLGGGLVEDMPALFREEIEAAARARVMPSFTKTFEVVVAGVPGDATVLGAVAWARQAAGGTDAGTEAETAGAVGRSVA